MNFPPDPVAIPVETPISRAVQHLLAANEELAAVVDPLDGPTFNLVRDVIRFGTDYLAAVNTGGDDDQSVS